ncbi:hypothetical protein E2320_000255, partial [Naja naja]
MALKARGIKRPDCDASRHRVQLNQKRSELEGPREAPSGPISCSMQGGSFEPPGSNLCGAHHPVKKSSCLSGLHTKVNTSQGGKVDNAKGMLEGGESHPSDPRQDTCIALAQLAGNGFQ